MVYFYMAWFYLLEDTGGGIKAKESTGRQLPLPGAGVTTTACLPDARGPDDQT